MSNSSAAHPRVTVFIPVYNAESFLSDTVESVLIQTYSDFELLAIDDGSTDKSVTILESFNDPRIRILKNQKNRGRPYTRNMGVELARGEYLSVLDADDLCEPDRLERQVKFLDENKNVAAVGSWAKYIDVNGKVAFICEVPVDGGEIHKTIFQTNCFIHSSVTFRRQAILDIGGYNMEFPQAQDYELFLRLSAHYDLANIAEPLVKYRVHPDQVSIRKLASQRRYADRARVTAYKHQCSQGAVIPIESMPQISTWRRLRGDPNTVGSDYIGWVKIYRALGRNDLTTGLVIRALFYAPFSIRAWRELRRNIGMTIFPPTLRNLLRWYKHKVITFFDKGSDL